MAWPDRPEVAKDIPHVEGDAIFDYISESASRAVAHFVAVNIEELEKITGGDAERENNLGSLLLELTSNVAEREAEAVQGAFFR